MINKKTIGLMLFNGAIISFWFIYLVVSGNPNIIGFAIILGVTIFAIFAIPYYTYVVLRCRMTDEVEIRKDERAKVNILRAYRNGFVFLLFFMMNIIVGWAFGMIDETTALYLLITAFGVGLLVPFLSYQIYERWGEK